MIHIRNYAPEIALHYRIYSVIHTGIVSAAKVRLWQGHNGDIRITFEHAIIIL
jgi:hypothetical protein